MARADGALAAAWLSRLLLWILRIWVVVDLVLLFLAFLLRLLGAEPTAGFTEWVYRSVDRAMAPFRGIFEPIELTGHSVLDTSLLFAMVVYGLVALVIQAGVDALNAWVGRRRYELAMAEHRDALAAAAAAANPLRPADTSGERGTGFIPPEVPPRAPVTRPEH